MKRYLRFLAIGSFFSTAEEFLTVALLKDAGSFLVTIVIVFPVYLTAAYWGGRLIDRSRRSPSTRDLIYYFAVGTAGLMFEWFVMNLAPWSAPNANPLLVLIFQLGMWSFWTTVAFAPRLFPRTDPSALETRRRILTFYLPYLVPMYIIAFYMRRASDEAKFVTIITPILWAHLVINFHFWRYFLLERQRDRSLAACDGPV